MSYTVKQLAVLSGVSIRTLHYYDEIGLLKPAYCGDNKYRYYEDEQLLLLQQILFYRELGFQLNDIQKVLCAECFDKIEALQSHKKLLKGDLDRMSTLIKTIDKTIAHLRGIEMIKLEEIFEGFTEGKQKLYEDFLVRIGISQSVISEMKAKLSHWSEAQWLANKAANDKVYAELTAAIEKKLSPISPEVQALIEKHYELTKVFWTPTKETYTSLARFYCSNVDFVAFYDAIHPKLLNFLTEAMEIFAEKKLS